MCSTLPIGCPPSPHPEHRLPPTCAPRPPRPRLTAALSAVLPTALPTLVVAALLASAAARTAAAQAPAQGADSAYPLGEIVVSADRPVSEAVATVRVVGPEEMRALGARTLADALALVPGLDLRTGADGVPRVDIRGFRTRQVTLLLNGIPLNATDDGQFDPTLIPVEEIAEIKVTGGTGSVLYGQGGLGGTINVITKSGAEGARASFGGEAREAGTWLGRATLSGGSGPVTVFASGSAVGADPFPSWSGSPTLGPVTGATRLNSDRDRRNGFVQAQVALGRRGSVGLTLNAVGGDQGVPPSIIADTADPFANRPVFERTDGLDGLAAQLAGSYVVAPRWTVRAWTYRNLQHTITSRYADSTLNPATLLTLAGTSRDTARSLLTGAGAQVGIGLVPVGRLTLGLVAERDLWQQQSWSAAKSGGGGGKGGGTPAPPTVTNANVDQRVHRYGVALEYEVRLGERVGLVAGGMHYWLDGQALSDQANGYSAGITVRAAAGTRLRVSAAHKFRFPTLSQLYDAVSGNPSLRTEHADLYEIGAEQRLGDPATVGLTLFQTDARDFINKPQGATQFQNADQFRFRGVEAVATVRPAERVFLRASYGFIDATDQAPGTDGVTIQYVPRNRLTGEARWAAPWGLSAALNVQHVAGEVYQSRSLPLELGNLPAFTLVGIRLEQRIPRLPLDVYGGVDNLFDEAYEQAYGFPAPRRVAYAGFDVGL